MNEALGRVPDACRPTHATAGSAWAALVLTDGPDGTPVLVKDTYLAVRIETAASAECRFTEWCFTWSDALGANARRVRTELELAMGGTHLPILTMWVRDPFAFVPGCRRPGDTTSSAGLRDIDSYLRNSAVRSSAHSGESPCSPDEVLRPLADMPNTTKRDR